MRSICVMGLIGLTISPARAHNLHKKEIVYRLKQHVDLLSRFDAKRITLQFIHSQDRCPLLSDVVAFNHDLVRLCAKKIAHENKLVALHETWDLFFNQYNFFEEELFLREFSQLLFTVYKNILQCMAQKEQLKVSRLPSLVTILRLYTQILSLPIGELLNALDYCYRQFHVLMREHGEPSHTNWRDWLSEHWWVPPVVILGIATNILVKYILSTDKEPSFC